jgi:hypothetical protein
LHVSEINDGVAPRFSFVDNLRACPHRLLPFATGRVTGPVVGYRLAATCLPSGDDASMSCQLRLTVVADGESLDRAAPVHRVVLVAKREMCAADTRRRV